MHSPPATKLRAIGSGCGHRMTSTGSRAPCSSPEPCGSTGAPANALRDNLSAATADQRVWRPDAFGSIAFLVASGFACVAVRRQLVADSPCRVTGGSAW